MALPFTHHLREPMKNKVHCRQAHAYQRDNEKHHAYHTEKETDNPIGTKNRQNKWYKHTKHKNNRQDSFWTHPHHLLSNSKAISFAIIHTSYTDNKHKPTKHTTRSIKYPLSRSHCP